VAVAAFLRVVNALENIRSGLDLLNKVDQAGSMPAQTIQTWLELALHETDDAIQVLQGGGLHPHAASRLEATAESIRRAMVTTSLRQRAAYVRDAMAEQNHARDHLAVM